MALFFRARPCELSEHALRKANSITWDRLDESNRQAILASGRRPLVGHDEVALRSLRIRWGSRPARIRLFALKDGVGEADQVVVRHCIGRISALMHDLAESDRKDVAALGGLTRTILVSPSSDDNTCLLKAVEGATSEEPDASSHTSARLRRLLHQTARVIKSVFLNDELCKIDLGASSLEALDNIIAASSSSADEERMGELEADAAGVLAAGLNRVVVLLCGSRDQAGNFAPSVKIYTAGLKVQRDKALEEAVMVANTGGNFLVQVPTGELCVFVPHADVLGGEDSACRHLGTPFLPSLLPSGMLERLQEVDLQAAAEEGKLVLAAPPGYTAAMLAGGSRFEHVYLELLQDKGFQGRLLHHLKLMEREGDRDYGRSFGMKWGALKLAAFGVALRRLYPRDPLDYQEAARFIAVIQPEESDVEESEVAEGMRAYSGDHDIMGFVDGECVPHKPVQLKKVPARRTRA